MIGFKSLGLMMALVVVQAASETFIKQCDDGNEYAMNVLGGSIPEPIILGDKNEIGIHCEVSAELPEDLIISLKIFKLAGDLEVPVPCLNGFGSCPYEVCPFVEDLGESLCQDFPEGQECGCPLMAAEYDLPTVTLDVQSFGDVMDQLMKGDYVAGATFYSASNEDEILGCIEMGFAMAPAE